MYHVTGVEGAVYGPVDKLTLDTWVAEGRIGQDSLISGGASVEWLPLTEHPDFAGHFAAAAVRPHTPRRRAFMAIVAGVTAFALLVVTVFAGVPLVRSNRWGLLPDVIAGTLRGDSGDAPHPEATTRPDTSAVHDEPFPGIKIDAPAGALDVDRAFTARRLDAAEMATADAAVSQQGLIALGGYDIDAGMAEEDLFFDPIDISFDLEDLGIPEALWSDVGIATVAKDGTVFLVDSELHRGVLAIETRHNGAWLPVLIPMLVAASTALVIKDRASIPAGDFSAIYWTPGAQHFRILYPSSWVSRDPAAVKQAEAEYAALLKKHKLTAADLASKPTAPAVDPFSELSDIGSQLAERLARLEALHADPEHQALRERAKSADWLKEAYLPTRVGHVLTALDRGREYLDHRGFRKPGVEKYGFATDVYIVDKSLGAELYGEAHNTWTASPFIVIDGTKVPDVDVSAFSALHKNAFDEIQMAAMHELFHVVQSAYVFVDRNRYLWFNEATAVLLEREAEGYYVTDKKYATTWDTTKRSYDVFFDPMDFFDSSGAKPNQQHGYGESYFFEFLRDYYFTTASARKQFLPKLYEDVASIRGGGIPSLYRTTGGTPESLQKVFYAFTYASGGEFVTAHTGTGTTPKTPQTTINAANPMHVMRFAKDGAPLSTLITQIDIDGAPGQSGAQKAVDPVYVLSTLGIEEHGAIVRLSVPAGSKGEWDEITGGCVLPAQRRFHVMRAETYVTAPAAVTGAGDAVTDHGPVVYGMYPGTAPTVEIKDEQVTVSWKPSPAAEVRQADGTGALISGYRVTLTMPDGKTTTFSVNEPRAEFPLELLDKLLKADKQTGKNQLFRALQSIGQRDAITLINITEALGAGMRPKIRIAYQEVAAIPGSPRGPLSAVTEFEYGDEERTSDDITGTWAGSVPFSEGELMRIDIVQQANGDFYGTMHWGDVIPIRGTWNATARSWSIEGRESQVWMPMFLVFNGQLQKLPGDKLYMFAPPALLSRHSSEAPDLGWEPEEGDMELKDLLNQIQQELDQMQVPAEGATP